MKDYHDTNMTEGVRSRYDEYEFEILKLRRQLQAIAIENSNLKNILNDAKTQVEQLKKNIELQKTLIQQIKDQLT